MTGIRIGVDVGGTFTDLVAHEPTTGAVVVGKLLTSEAPDEGVLRAIGGALSPEALAGAETFVHGTTVGLNALLERRGATVGLLVTRGFRDVLELRRGDREDPYDLFWRAPAPLVPRHLRLPVGGRIRADGTEHAPFVPEDVAAAAEVFAAAGVDAVAIAFMNAYANPDHELEAARRLREAGYTGELALSHRISGEYREYERTCTTVVDAFVRRRMGPYLERLDDRLRGLGFGGDALVTRSGRGAMTFAQAGGRPLRAGPPGPGPGGPGGGPLGTGSGGGARPSAGAGERPSGTILGGPVAGAQGGAILSRELGLEQAIAADVGGTSFDTCLITDGEAPVLYEGRVIGLPL